MLFGQCIDGDSCISKVVSQMTPTTEFSRMKRGIIVDLMGHMMGTSDVLIILDLFVKQRYM